MPKNIQIAAQEIAEHMPLTESSVDQALAAMADLMGSLVRARIDTGVPAAAGQAAILRLAKAQMALVDVSSDVLRVHTELVKAGREYAGMDNHEECPPAQAAVKLRAVA